ncbi:isopentenyl diphosphate isomerase/L-lactate dehydrogenase-like FMN-dependent dehydrogenase [Novosphingobium sp. SG916]|nr:isopentenyl diphosphate isomerase/L-lactate dehydrogenase-like FMN-dependent dehydrogenase [Novosphingobium sp. SG919]NMN89674.1 isopentenyl diphosphate isomerase/L-lactate dehydrogenase-like FMN-dependent dehydrogenase [Novosphingobium sp. SG916]
MSAAPLPDDIATLADYERHAAARLAPATWAHIQQGATLANRAALARWGLVPRMLRALDKGGTATTLFGQIHAAPILLAPVAYHRLAHVQGEIATAQAAAAMNTALVASTLSSVPLEAIAQALRDAAGQLQHPAPPPAWFQLYAQPDPAHSLALVRRAEAAGYGVLVFTVDAAIKRAEFVLPDGVGAANLAGFPAQRHHAGAQGQHLVFGSPLARQAPTWETLAWLRRETALPLVVKGLLHPDDALRARDAGADGVIVSNHAGRVLDGVVPALAMLPSIRAALGPGYPLLLDGGIRSGADALKAMALGAQAVLVGAPQLHALAVGGMAGVAHMLHILRTEFELAMAQCGCAHVGEIDPALVVAL